ncbi:MAG: site-2 protease family protein [Chloroflexi bacterium]|nr:MAG: site-2 protease family protein [Chloroflexota bacterium]
MFSDPVQFVINAIYLVPGLLVGLIGHGLAQAAFAVARGDQTPRVDGRLSLDPSRHLDPLGTIAAFFINFGWAKEVRINPYRMRSTLDPALVALAGPVANLLIAIVLSIPIKLALAAGSFDPAGPPWRLLLVAFYFNVALGVISLVPIPPLDGYLFLERLFRRRYGRQFARIDAQRQLIQLVFVLLVLLTGILSFLYLPVARLILRLPPFAVGS